jgi:hypothetical protein
MPRRSWLQGVGFSRAQEEAGRAAEPVTGTPTRARSEHNGKRMRTRKDTRLGLRDKRCSSAGNVLKDGVDRGLPSFNVVRRAV